MSLSLRQWVFAVALGLGLWVVIAVVLVTATAHAQEGGYTADDTKAAITQASSEIGVSAAYLTAVVQCEVNCRVSIDSDTSIHFRPGKQSDF